MSSLTEMDYIQARDRHKHDKKINQQDSPKEESLLGKWPGLINISFDQYVIIGFGILTLGFMAVIITYYL